MDLPSKIYHRAKNKYEVYHSSFEFLKDDILRLPFM